MQCSGFSRVSEYKIHPEVRIIVQSAYAGEEERLAAENAECNEYLAVPVGKDEQFQLQKKIIV